MSACVIKRTSDTGHGKWEMKLNFELINKQFKIGRAFLLLLFVNIHLWCNKCNLFLQRENEESIKRDYNRCTIRIKMMWHRPCSKSCRIFDNKKGMSWFRTCNYWILSASKKVGWPTTIIMLEWNWVFFSLFAQTHTHTRSPTPINQKHDIVKLDWGPWGCFILCDLSPIQCSFIEFT